MLRFARSDLGEPAPDTRRATAERNAPQQTSTDKIQAVGYARVSTTVQNLATQRSHAGVKEIRAEKISGVAAKRPVLARLLDDLEPGDRLVVTPERSPAANAAATAARGPARGNAGAMRRAGIAL